MLIHNPTQCRIYLIGSLAFFLSVGLLVGFSVGHTSAQTNDNHATDIKLRPHAVLSQPMTVGWRYDSSLTLNLTPASDEERLYLPLAGGIIVSLNGADGQLNWRSEMGGELSASPVADERGVYVASETGKPETGVRRATGALRSLGREVESPNGCGHWRCRCADR